VLSPGYPGLRQRPSAIPRRRLIGSNTYPFFGPEGSFGGGGGGVKDLPISEPSLTGGRGGGGGFGGGGGGFGGGGGGFGVGLSAMFYLILIEVNTIMKTTPERKKKPANPPSSSVADANMPPGFSS